VSERVVVAMSGGVDSSVAAALAVEAGHEVVGVTLHLAGDASRCCSLADAEDARRVAETLGIRFYVANLVEAFHREVVEPFADAYLAGRTPLPCVACNKRFKFDRLLERARVLGASRVVTGHYARVETEAATGLHCLRRARDARKDQSYFLFNLDQAQLARIWLPLGSLAKDEVRARARALGLATAEKPESQEICFVPDGDYARVVEALRPEARGRGGSFVDREGRALGAHRGVHRYTVGQRRGLGLAAGSRLYVTAIDAATGRVIVGGAEDVLAAGARVEDASWITGAPPAGALRAEVRVRHRHAGAKATLVPLRDARVRVEFDEPVAAIAPGQAAVFYDGDAVLGGGWIAGAIA
jgi:tRNA-specific 2-thiouridylase